MAADEQTVLKAYKFAQHKHKGQLDDTKEDYFRVHICQVFRILQNVTNDANILAACLLHDTLEDTQTTVEELIENFGTDITMLVLEVTHEGNKTTGYFFPRLKTQSGIMIKFADRLSNISRMEAWSDDRKAHYLKKSKFWESEK